MQFLSTKKIYVKPHNNQAGGQCSIHVWICLVVDLLFGHLQTSSHWSNVRPIDGWGGQGVDRYWSLSFLGHHPPLSNVRLWYSSNCSLVTKLAICNHREENEIIVKHLVRELCSLCRKNSYLLKSISQCWMNIISTSATRSHLEDAFIQSHTF